jgi:hypothetical protein
MFSAFHIYNTPEMLLIFCLKNGKSVLCGIVEVFIGEGRYRDV